MGERKDKVGLAGEKDTERIALKVFYGEFVFSDLWFINKNIGQGTNIELADLIINIEDECLAFQVKTRNGKAQDGGDKKWLAKQIKNAKKQLVDTFHNIQIDNLPEFVNKKGSLIELGKRGIFSGIIILKNESIYEYPKIVKSNRLNGIVHCFTEKDFDTCCEELVIPKDILEYLDFREKYYEIDKEIKEQEKVCIDKFLLNKYGNTFLNLQLVNDFKKILGDFQEKLLNKEKSDYRYIVQVLAMFGRTEISMFTGIFGKLFAAAQNGIYSDDMFIKPINGNKHSILFISQKNLDRECASYITQLFMYQHKIDKCLTVILHIEDEDKFEVDWLLRESPWRRDLQMENLINELNIQDKWNPKKQVTDRTGY